MSEFEAARDPKKLVFGVVLVAVIVVAAFVVLTLPPPGEEQGKTLTILTRHDVTIHNVYESAFLSTDFAIENNIEGITWRTPSSEFWDDLIDTGEIDVCWGGGPTLFDQLMRDDYLEPLISANMTEVATRVNDTIAGADVKRRNSEDQLVWIGAAISSFGFTVNHNFLDTYSLPVPQKWTDLANATYGSLLPAIPTIAMGNAPDTTSNTRIYEIITQGLGWDAGWTNLARMAGSANIYLGSVETQAASETGAVGVSMSIDFYGYLTQSKNPDTEYIVPTGQSIVNADPIAIASTSTQKNLAEGFVDFIFTPEAQSLWLDPNIKRMPIMREAFDTPLGQDNLDLYAVYNETVKNIGIDFNDTLSLEINTAFVKYFEAVFTDAHDDLVDCWDLIVDAYLDGHLSESQLNDYASQMGHPVTIEDPDGGGSQEFTIEYARQINLGMVYDSVYAGQLQTLWTAAAKAQYQSVYDAVFALIP